ncbi:MAG: tRNA (adenosine(37)-N6)-dimethylallyltransferase MiaA [Acidobacteria bacterium]|nr:tRNA (adenosine(37)-N6)-dimethylallyltransferase MiaA [Acidobacteriota bacterium]
MSNPYPGIVIVGPTASGKSRMGIALATRFNGEILSCDALQLYRRMNIGTAKVTQFEREQVPHHMLDLLDPAEEFSAGTFQDLARKSLEVIRGRGRIPFVVGGTGFYLRALLEGLFDGPSREETLRARMRKIIERKGPKVLHRALERVDPQSASQIAEADGERIIRAYEIYLVSGQPMSWWQRQPRNALSGYRWLKIGIHVARARLYERINTRVDQMFRSGFLEEVESLMALYPGDSPGFKAIGYRQAVEYFNGHRSLDDAIEDTKMESRRYAKRQVTWFRRDPDIHWIEDEGESEKLAAEAEAMVERFLGEIGSKEAEEGFGIC